MPNAILYKHGSDEISYFVKDCLRKGNDFIGSNCKLIGIKPSHWAIKWTEDIVNSVGGNWDKTVSEIYNTNKYFEINKPSESDFRAAVKIREEIAGLTYNQLDNYIDKHVIDLISAKQYLKKLSKAILAITKIMDKEIG